MCDASDVLGISLLTLVPGISGGSETYARELCRALARVGELEYRVFVPPIAPDAGEGLPSEVVRSYPASRSMPGRIAAMSLAAARPGPLRRALRVDALDALHFPLSVMLPPVTRPPAATSVLDLQHEHHPEFFGRPELAYRKLVYGWTIRRSRIVIAISEHARQTLLERYALPPDRVRTIHLGIDHARFRPGEPQSSTGPFLLYPARAWPHKNHARLFEAFAILRRERPDLRLVLTNYDGPKPPGVESRGRVSQVELAELYRGAAALVFPSLYEGFGQPPLEAMACGCPVACSNVASLPEVVDDGARLFDPTQPEAIAEAVEDVLRDPQPWIERGFARAAAFTWDACAREHDVVYRELESMAP
ncbi:MAG: glycosyltransferase family 4 protein [Actinomycetota bacterium]|nr:glycosyltransferase family 4 protein [Actinomycetota bacterium]